MKRTKKKNRKIKIKNMLTGSEDKNLGIRKKRNYGLLEELKECLNQEVDFYVEVFRYYKEAVPNSKIISDSNKNALDFLGKIDISIIEFALMLGNKSYAAEIEALYKRYYKYIVETKIDEKYTENSAYSAFLDEKNTIKFAQMFSYKDFGTGKSHEQYMEEFNKLIHEKFLFGIDTIIDNLNALDIENQNDYSNEIENKEFRKLCETLWDNLNELMNASSNIANKGFMTNGNNGKTVQLILEELHSCMTTLYIYTYLTQKKYSYKILNFLFVVGHKNLYDLSIFYDDIVFASTCIMPNKNKSNYYKLVDYNVIENNKNKYKDLFFKFGCEYRQYLPNETGEYNNGMESSFTITLDEFENFVFSLSSSIESLLYYNGFLITNHFINFPYVEFNEKDKEMILMSMHNKLREDANDLEYNERFKELQIIVLSRIYQLIKIIKKYKKGTMILPEYDIRKYNKQLISSVQKEEKEKNKELTIKLEEQEKEIIKCQSKIKKLELKQNEIKKEKTETNFNKDISNKEKEISALIIENEKLKEINEQYRKEIEKWKSKNEILQEHQKNKIRLAEKAILDSVNKSNVCIVANGTGYKKLKWLKNNFTNIDFLDENRNISSIGKNNGKSKVVYIVDADHCGHGQENYLKANKFKYGVIRTHEKRRVDIILEIREIIDRCIIE